MSADSLEKIAAAARRSIALAQKALEGDAMRVEAPPLLDALEFDNEDLGRPVLSYASGQQSEYSRDESLQLTHGHESGDDTHAGRLGAARAVEIEAADRSDDEPQELSLQVQDEHGLEEGKQKEREERLFQQRSERLWRQQQEERRLEREEANERRALELETLQDQRYAKLVRATAAAEKKAVEMSEEMVVAHQLKDEWEATVRHEVSEAREAIMHAEAQSKHSARAFRLASDRSEKTIMEIRSEAKVHASVRSEAARGNKRVAAELRRTISDLNRSHAAALRRSDDATARSTQAEEACANAESRLEAEMQKVKPLRATARCLQGKARAASSDVSGAELAALSIDTGFLAAEEAKIQELVAEASADRLAESEEAALSSALNSTEVRCMSLEIEEGRLSGLLGKVEAESAKLQERLRTSPRKSAAMEGGDVWALTERRDELSIRVSTLREELECEAATAAKRIADGVASQQLSFVYEQLRGVCVNGHRDLEELAAVVEERQASFALSRDLESTLYNEEWKAVAAIPEGAAMEAHDEAMRELQTEHVQFLQDTELRLCSMEVLEAELWESERSERAAIWALADDVRSISGSPQKAVSLVSSGCSDLASARVYQSALTAYVDKFASQKGIDMNDLQRQEKQLQTELAEAKTKHYQLQMHIRAAEEEACATGDEALAVVVVPVDTQSLTDMAKALEDARHEYHAEYDSLSGRCSELRLTADLCRTRHKQEFEKRNHLCTTFADAFRGDLAAKQRERCITEAEVSQTISAVELLKAHVSSELQEQAIAQSQGEMEVEVTLRMHSQIDSLGLADEELQTRHDALSARAEHAARACKSEEEALQTVSAELARVRSNQIITDGALSNKTVSLEVVAADLAAVTVVCEASCALRASEQAQLKELLAKSAKMCREVNEEEAMTRTLKGNIVQEAEESRIAAECLATVRSEALWLGRARAREAGAVVELKSELADSSQMAIGATTSITIDTPETQVMKTEIDALSAEQGQLAERGKALRSELSATQEQHADLRHAVKAQEERHATLAKSQGDAVAQQIVSQRTEIAELNASIAANRDKLDHDSRRLDEAMKHIGALQGDQRCAEAASTTEEEALAAVCRDKSNENAACVAMQAQLLAVRCELGNLHNTFTTHERHPAASSSAKIPNAASVAARGGRSNDGDAALRGERVEADVLKAIAHAARTSPGDAPGEALAVVGTPHFARQLLIAQALLEDWYQQELLHIRERGLARRRHSEEQMAQQEARRLALEELRLSELKSWSLDRDQLAKRLRNSELEHAKLESNLLGEIFQLDSAEHRCEAATLSESSVGTLSEVATKERSANGAVLAEMNASLRQTHCELCNRQGQLEDITRERDRLQAHLVKALERAGAQNGGFGPAQTLPGPALAMPMATVV